MSLRFLTAGESHGPALSVILEGMPAGLSLNAAVINKELVRRQQGYGAGPRMKIEQDAVRRNEMGGFRDSTLSKSWAGCWKESRRVHQ